MKIRMRSELIVFFKDTATTEIYTLSLHDALPISVGCSTPRPRRSSARSETWVGSGPNQAVRESSGSSGWRMRTSTRSEEHTSELQSRQYLVCRLLLEQKKSTVSRNIANRKRAQRC